MAFSSPFDIAERSADYWKRQLTLEETGNLSCRISLLNRYSFCQWAFAITLILMGKGWVYRSEWHWDRRSLFVEHPQQHTLKLRKYILRYFLLIQFFTALQISVAETQEYFSISNLTHSVWTVSHLVNCCDSWKNTTGLDISDRHCPLTLVWSNEVFEVCFWIMASVSEALIFYLVEAFFPSKLAR